MRPGSRIREDPTVPGACLSRSPAKCWPWSLRRVGRPSSHLCTGVNLCRAAGTVLCSVTGGELHTTYMRKEELVIKHADENRTLLVPREFHPHFVFPSEHDFLPRL